MYVLLLLLFIIKIVHNRQKTYDHHSYRLVRHGIARNHWRNKIHDLSSYKVTL